jgi:hypothetical protein
MEEPGDRSQKSGPIRLFLRALRALRGDSCFSLEQKIDRHLTTKMGEAQLVILSPKMDFYLNTLIEESAIIAFFIFQLCENTSK